MIARRVFQFETKASKDGRGRIDEGVRWIAAPTEAQARAVARSKRWRPVIQAATTEIFQGYSAVPKTPDGLRKFGCDVVIP